MLSSMNHGGKQMPETVIDPSIFSCRKAATIREIVLLAKKSYIFCTFILFPCLKHEKSLCQEW